MSRRIVIAFKSDRYYRLLFSCFVFSFGYGNTRNAGRVRFVTGRSSFGGFVLTFNMMSIPTNNLKLAVEMATRVESAMAKRVGDQPEVRSIHRSAWPEAVHGFFSSSLFVYNMSPFFAQTQCTTPQQASPQLKTQFEINDLADTDRILLTSKSIQNDIEEFSGR